MSYNRSRNYWPNFLSSEIVLINIPSVPFCTNQFFSFSTFFLSCVDSRLCPAMDTSIINQYAYYTPDNEDVFLVQTWKHENCIRWMRKPSGIYACFRRLPPVTPFNHLAEVYEYLQLIRPSTRIEMDCYDGQLLHIYQHPLPGRLHRIVVESFPELFFPR